MCPKIWILRRYNNKDGVSFAIYSIFSMRNCWIIREGTVNVYLKLLRVIICESYVFTIFLSKILITGKTKPTSITIPVTTAASSIRNNTTTESPRNATRAFFFSQTPRCFSNTAMISSTRLSPIPLICRRSFSTSRRSMDLPSFSSSPSA